MTWGHPFRHQQRKESLPGCTVSKEAAVVREKCWLSSCCHLPESTSLFQDEWLQEHEFCKVGAGLSSRCGLTRRSWANLIAYWPHHNLINLRNCQKTNPAKVLLPTLLAKLSQTRPNLGQGSVGGSRCGEVRLPSAAASRSIKSVKLARQYRNLVLAMFV